MHLRFFITHDFLDNPPAVGADDLNGPAVFVLLYPGLGCVGHVRVVGVRVVVVQRYFEGLAVFKQVLAQVFQVVGFVLALGHCALADHIVALLVQLDFLDFFFLLDPVFGRAKFFLGKISD